jgi:hypothetical protein
MANGNPEVEYQDVSDNIRHYGSMRFVLLTLFGTLSATIMAALFLGMNPPPTPTKTVLKCLGIILVVAFGLMDQRASEYWSVFWKRAVKLETQLHYSQYKARPRRQTISIHNATRLLYVAVLVFWIIALAKPDWI